MNGKTSSLYKDFAHAPSKVKATADAVKEQFKDYRLIACLELHTYSSLDPSFIKKYRASLSQVDLPIVYYDPEALKLKNRTPISTDEIKKAFGEPKLEVFTHPDALNTYLFGKNYDRTVLLMMSSGNYGGLNWERLKERVLQF